MKRVFPLLLGLLVMAIPAFADRITVFAAASLRGALEEATEGFDGDLALSYAGSGTMARQIAAGAPADVVILAHEVWMDWLRDRGAVKQARVLLQNRLVVIGPDGAAPLKDPQRLLGRLGDGRLAMGQRDAVPAGAYAQAWLRQVGIWPDLVRRLAETDNVRAALALVARGDVPLGMVYATDAKAEPRVAVIFEVPETAHAPIRYPAAALTPAGRALLDHLGSEGAGVVFRSHGFVTP